MYSPNHYQVSDWSLIQDIMTNYRLATIIAAEGDKLDIAHLPLFLKEADGKSYLIGHMARANSLWSHASGKKVTCIFSGPQAYISPSWYKPHPANVPTWNYVAIHVKGIFQVVNEQTEALRSLIEQVGTAESVNATNWQMTPTQEVGLLMKQIVMFKIEHLEIEAKFKMSQKQDQANRNNVIHELETRGNLVAAKYMRKVESV